MTKIRDIYNQQKRLYENGKNFSAKGYEPKSFLKHLVFIIDSAYKLTPEHMVNKDEFRRNQSQKVIDAIHKDLYDKMVLKTSFLGKYTELSPRDKLSYWGAMFDTALEFFTYSASNSYKHRDCSYISKQEYNKIPKRYRSAIKKQNGGYSIDTTPNEGVKPVLFIKDISLQEKAFSLLNEAKELVSLIYKHEFLENKLIDFHEYIDSEGALCCKYVTENIYGAKPSSHRLFQHLLISDEQIKAVERLKEILQNLPGLFWIIPSKANATDTIAEYKDAKRRHDIVLEAQRHVRTASQVVVSTKKHKTLFDKHDVKQAEIDYNTEKTKTLAKLNRAMRIR